MLKARKMLTKWCKGILAYVVADDSSEVSLGDIRMVREFSDIFLEDLYGMPPDWEIEFFIDFLFGTAPIFKAPYQMALIKLKKLK